MYFLIVAWLSVVAAGLGSEMVLGHIISKALVNMKNGYAAWHFAQLIFSLLLTVAFTANDGIGLFFLSLGLWKMGFPETVSALVAFQKAKRKRSSRALASLFDGMGMLLHHFSTSLVITAICLHIFPRNRAITAGCIVPILQHLFVLVKYHARGLYILLELGLEVWFQIEVICNVAEFDSGLGLDVTNLGRGLALSMLLAHYMYLTAAALGMLGDALKRFTTEEAEPARALDTSSGDLQEWLLHQSATSNDNLRAWLLRQPSSEAVAAPAPGTPAPAPAKWRKASQLARTERGKLNV